MKLKRVLNCSVLSIFLLILFGCVNDSLEIDNTQETFAKVEIDNFEKTLKNLNSPENIALKKDSNKEITERVHDNLLEASKRLLIAHGDSVEEIDSQAKHDPESIIQKAIKLHQKETNGNLKN